ncbi:elongation factor 4 [bacterium (Candidatus Torokbacteria) CG_4_10_14_0_2_um_filter_35_8]|nr:MAG: elongation factor 4 [bacterium (Candidatus Torokbacteria) CG_4_10_14_0_2_um_filter_35_8]
MHNTRNFCIIAHIDHGKSTLSDRFLEITKTVPKNKMRQQFLDNMDLERERGITIKLRPVQMEYEFDTGKGVKKFYLNLIDTPGHIDFTYEVSRSLLCCEGAILLVDATCGIQAQTLANLEMAQEANLKIIPVVNKIDLPNAEIDKTKEEIVKVLNIKENEILSCSAKSGRGVEEVLKKIIKEIPYPKGDSKRPFKALIFDSLYDSYQGVIVYVRVFDGKISAKDKILLFSSKKTSDVKEVGVFKPELIKKERLSAGDIGYIVTGLKKIEYSRMGDTVSLAENPIDTPLPGYKVPIPKVFANFFEKDIKGSENLKQKVEKLKLNDSSLEIQELPWKGSDVLGQGVRMGFLGLLHLEITKERLEREFGLDLIVTTPQVRYKINFKDGKEKEIFSTQEMPDQNLVESIEEPYSQVEILTPSKYLGQILKLCTIKKGKYVSTDFLSEGRVRVTYEMPLREIIIDFYDKIKSISSGFASLNYKILDFRRNDLVKLDILIAGKFAPFFSQIVPRRKAESEGRRILIKLKKLIPKALFPIALQASIGSKIIARETISALKKNVTAKLYGGDVTRKNKLLKKQKKGKKKMTLLGSVEIPKDVYFKIIQRD